MLDCEHVSEQDVASFQAASPSHGPLPGFPHVLDTHERGHQPRTCVAWLASRSCAAHADPRSLAPWPAGSSCRPGDGLIDAALPAGKSLASPSLALLML